MCLFGASRKDAAWLHVFAMLWGTAPIANAFPQVRSHGKPEDPKQARTNKEFALQTVREHSDSPASFSFE
jgi:hypothetical protein